MCDLLHAGPLGITLHFFNSSNMTAEDVAIHAAPYMAVTSFNGDGGPPEHCLPARLLGCDPGLRSPGLRRVRNVYTRARALATQIYLLRREPSRWSKIRRAVSDVV